MAADEKPKPISLRLDAEMHAAVDEAVDGGDRSAWIKGAIRMRLQQSKMPQPAEPSMDLLQTTWGPDGPVVGGRKLARRGRTAAPLAARSTRATFAARRR